MCIRVLQTNLCTLRKLKMHPSQSMHRITSHQVGRAGSFRVPRQRLLGGTRIILLTVLGGVRVPVGWVGLVGSEANTSPIYFVLVPMYHASVPSHPFKLSSSPAAISFIICLRVHLYYIRDILALAQIIQNPTRPHTYSKQHRAHNERPSPLGLHRSALLLVVLSGAQPRIFRAICVLVRLVCIAQHCLWRS